MRVETLRALMGAYLLSTPSITAVAAPTFDAKKVQRGDLFFAFDEGSIDTALQNGAYGIVVEKPTRVTDSEVAWLQVKDLHQSAKKLLRYQLTQKNKTFYLIHPYQFDILKQCCTSKEVTFIQNSAAGIFSIFDENKQVFIADDKGFLEEFTKDYSDLTQIDGLGYEILRNTLFESDIILDGLYHQNIPLPHFFIPQLAKATAIAKEIELSYQLSKLGYCNFYYPCFFNAKLQPTEFGKGTKVLLFCPFDAVYKQLQPKLQHLKSTCYDKSSVTQLHTLLSTHDFIVVSCMDHSITQMPPFTTTQKRYSLLEF